MAITTRDQLIDAFTNNSQPFLFDKSGVVLSAPGQTFSYWLTSGVPTAGAVPAAPVITTGATPGALSVTASPGGTRLHLLQATMSASQSPSSAEIHDRMAHMGGLSMIVTTSQTVGLDLSTIGLPADRIGSANYSDVEWWLEIFANGGVTSTVATVNVTFNDGTSNNLSGITLGATPRSGRLFSLQAARQASDAGRFIRAVNSVTLSLNTSIAGNFGFSATRRRAQLSVPVASKIEVFDWAQLGIPFIHPDACLMLIVLATTTLGPVVRISGRLGYN